MNFITSCGNINVTKLENQVYRKLQYAFPFNIYLVPTIAVPFWSSAQPLVEPLLPTGHGTVAHHCMVTQPRPDCDRSCSAVTVLTTWHQECTGFVKFQDRRFAVFQP